MNIPIEPIQVLSLELPEAYGLLQIIKIDLEDDKEIRQVEAMVENGINEDFYIMNYINGNYVNKPKQQIMIIERKIIPYKRFYTEINTRNAMLKKVILDYIKEEDIIKSRE